MDRQRTGGGRGSNQYRTRGVSQARQHDATAIGGLVEVGVPGGWLASDEAHQKFGSAASVGMEGEIRTAQMLRRHFSGDPTVTVCHDLSVPGLDRANVDHAVTRGNVVVLVDSKQWKPGTYWKVGRFVFRGLSHFSFAERTGAQIGVERWAAELGSKAQVSGLIVVHSSSPQGQVKLRFRHLHGLRVVGGEQACGIIDRRLRWARKDKARIAERLKAATPQPPAQGPVAPFGQGGYRRG